MNPAHCSTSDSLPVVYTSGHGVYCLSVLACAYTCTMGGLLLCFVQVYVVVGIAAVAFTGFLLMLVILKFGGNSKFGIKGKTPKFYLLWWPPS